MTFPVIGVVGGGQLARMMAPPATALGFELRVLAEGEDVSAVAAVATAPVGDYKDLDTLLEFAKGVDVLTFDHEHVPTDHLHALLDAGVNVQPGPESLVNAQDKLVMRAAIDRLGLPNPEWAAVNTVEELVAFGDKIGWPVVLKTPRGGYDGKGVRIVDSPEDAADTASWFQAMSPLLAEAKVDFSRELSALVARTPSGEARAWPVVHTIQVDGVCDEVIAPAQNISVEVAAAAEDAALRIATELGVTGVMAAELFETPGVGAGFLINELAMRPHNTGHWTQDGSITSQFEQHLRAVLDLPLGATDALAPVAVMKNFLGGENQDLFAAFPLALAFEPAAKVHCYGKSVRPGRKIGHVNLLGTTASDVDSVRARATAVANTIRDGRVPSESSEENA
ncbi:5-(carboxyamino)imidazole ribonucleotide synthase [Arthrobacter sp. TES]|uniref:5-(carboxyamino)imidazole ribonucleotide synthase n=1 Tax=Paenarthrobacter TaxID=1742992 RepID=UPI0003F6FCB4|nr:MULTISPECIES: 5-(carboxyamino)imidazole ribonucleotide synthase [Paenarthrobacter]AOY72236.1 phosphoribosylaminoimidazole carboxylase [Arthrobacter sp. ZXY-2]QOI63938.1 5-(carboxyamino)imidazole ribonucleotide synthase [Arthrobacter sp. TES]MBN9129895.1 5-(carboxyamino)imidazole ribonucleotide synthase [Paenarthrobacter ureafaciens]MCX8454070.1 5-(carboxyamino)imidazole ribonucleotide synthase [Paenarthrobacter ureafaciens]MCY0972140.1 5-(carboxyamino)imidazole ribonucleotide synthase [Paen